MIDLLKMIVMICNMKCSIKIDVIVISPRLSRPHRSDTTQVVYIDQNYYIQKKD